MCCQMYDSLGLKESKEFDYRKHFQFRCSLLPFFSFSRKCISIEMKMIDATHVCKCVSEVRLNLKVIVNKVNNKFTILWRVDV